MIISLAGNNPLEIRRRLDEIIGQFKIEHGDLAIERIDGEEASAQTIIDAAQSLPFLARRKLIVVRSLSTNKSAAEEVEQIISSAADSTDIIFYEPLTDKRTTFYKTLKAKTSLEEHNEPEASALPKWLVETAEKLGGSLRLADANYLIERVSTNQLRLANELEKLIIFEPNISRHSIDLLTEKTPRSKVFDLLDAAFAGKKARALQLYKEQRVQKIEPQEILAMIAWQLKLITLAQLGRGKTAAEIAKDAGVSSFPITKAQSLARRLSGKQLSAMVSEAKKIDRLGKTKSIDLDEALKTYITTL